MNNISETSKKLTFWQLIQDTKIEIPIIQRDYAQGRIDKKSIRKKILNNFVNSISSNESVELDFIYGSKEENSMQPLDGQQRLTTLFLLHWYIACKDNKLVGFKKVFNNFTYETRTSSREFCIELVNHGIDIQNLLKPDENKNNELSKSIVNSSWFFLSWRKDPTIKAMLIMLDDIHHKFYNVDHAWEKLTEQNLIKFNYIELENFGLSDDLYIKMNARGKMLTDFENFKALFEHTISQQKWEENTTNLLEKFSHKADTVWTDLFWPYRDKNNLIDNSFLKMISIVFLVQQDNKEKVQQIFNSPHEITPEDFNERSFNYLKSVLDTYHRIGLDGLQFSFPLWQYLEKESTNFFHAIIKHQQVTYPQIVLFYAQTSFLLKDNIFECDAFRDWMRVIRNIVNNSTIDSAETFMAAISLVKELSNGYSDIYNHLANKKITAGHARVHVKEEVEKAKLILVNPKNKEVIHETEDSNFCKGKIDFVLYCIDYNISEKPDANQFDADKLRRIKDVVIEHLSEDDVTNDFRRAFLTIGDNDFYEYWKSYLYAVKAPKHCLLEDIEDLKNYFATRGMNNKNITNGNWDYLKELLKELSNKDIDALISDYIQTSDFNKLSEWKQRVIRQDVSLGYSMKHYIAVKDDICWLIPASKVANDRNGRDRLLKV